MDKEAVGKVAAFTAVFLGVTRDEAKAIVEHPKWSAGSWSHAIYDRDEARAELERARAAADALAQQPAAQAAGLTRFDFTGQRDRSFGECADGKYVLYDDVRALLSRAAPSGEPVAYVECRECGRCGHTGINDAHSQDECCSNCDWTGPAPKEDVCPGCAQTGTMRAACPKCGSVYRLLCETTVGAAPQPSAQQAEPDGGYLRDIIQACAPAVGAKPDEISAEEVLYLLRKAAEKAQAEQRAEEAPGVEVFVPRQVIEAITRYGDARADAVSPTEPSEALGEVVRLIRALAASKEA
ncbi:hypothetical protein NDR89_23325 [Cupriavidus gilardii]|uniref:CR-type domain-containing protein n=1 Tax=Cupriavidus gilardii TaxID=82541 RepID=A0ABY4VR90_9BURK|nr:hypothetical protein [Cupriavidus gilardii]USE79526.1 hypothetical protein NDR89_23325 [Cupriavidus gilardii]